jgi:hypothetical protein
MMYMGSSSGINTTIMAVIKTMPALAKRLGETEQFVSPSDNLGIEGIVLPINDMGGTPIPGFPPNVVAREGGALAVECFAFAFFDFQTVGACRFLI